MTISYHFYTSCIADTYIYIYKTTARVCVCVWMKIVYPRTKQPKLSLTAGSSFSSTSKYSLIAAASLTLEGLSPPKPGLSTVTRQGLNQNTIVYRYRSCYTIPLYCTGALYTLGYTVLTNHKRRLTFGYTVLTNHKRRSTFAYTVLTNHKRRLR